MIAHVSTVESQGRPIAMPARAEAIRSTNASGLSSGPPATRIAATSSPARDALRAPVEGMGEPSTALRHTANTRPPRPIPAPGTARSAERRTNSPSPSRAAPAGRNAGTPHKPATTRYNANRSRQPGEAQKPDHPITFQSFFKSVGPRTYAAQVKIATNGNHYLVLTEGQRDDKTGEVRKKRVNIFSEDFAAFFKLLRETAEHIHAHPVPEEVRQRQAKFWSRKRKAKPDDKPS